MSNVFTTLITGIELLGLSSSIPNLILSLVFTIWILIELSFKMALSFVLREIFERYLSKTNKKAIFAYFFTKNYCYLANKGIKLI